MKTWLSLCWFHDQIFACRVLILLREGSPHLLVGKAGREGREGEVIIVRIFTVWTFEILEGFQRKLVRRADDS